MGTATADSSRSVIIKNAQGQVVTGTSVAIGSSASFTAHISSSSGQYVFQISGASFSGGSCTGAVRSTADGTSFTPTGPGVVKVHVGFATGYRGISISPMATITFTAAPSKLPTALPTKQPSARPTATSPTMLPTTKPTATPTTLPTALPTTTARPTALPTQLPTRLPTVRPTISPTALPSAAAPSAAPSPARTNAPTTRPSSAPTSPPTPAPSAAAAVLQVSFSVSGFASLADAQLSKGAIKTSLAVSLQLNETNIASLTLSAAARRLGRSNGRALADGVAVAAVVNVPSVAAATSVDSSLTRLASSFASNMAATGVTGLGVTNLVTVNISPTLAPTAMPTELSVSAPAASGGGGSMVVIAAGAGGGLALVLGVIGYMLFSRAQQGKVASTSKEAEGRGLTDAEEAGVPASNQIRQTAPPRTREPSGKKKGPKPSSKARRGVLPDTLQP